MAAEVTEIAPYGLEKRDFAHLESRKGLSRVSEPEFLGVTRASYDAIAEDYAVEFAQVLAVEAGDVGDAADGRLACECGVGPVVVVPV
jgi:hypothetical protein